MARRRIFNGGKARDLREERGLLIGELVDKLGDNPQTNRPWHPDTLTNVELGRTQPGLKLSHAWANALGVPWVELMQDAPEDGDTP